MATEKVFEFLQSCSVDELKQRGILRGKKNLLNNQSLAPLIKLMQARGISRLEDAKSDWFLDVEGNFRNSKSGEDLKEGNFADLSNQGNVFNYKNVAINPYYLGYFPGTPNDMEIEMQYEEAEQTLFLIERDLQNALCRNIEQLENQLKIVDKERYVDGGKGRIDILAEDRDNKLVVIELKAGEAKPDSITQILAYMGSLRKEEQREIRGILVAASFHPKVILASQEISHLQLKTYSYTFSFKQV